MGQYELWVGGQTNTHIFGHINTMTRPGRVKTNKLRQKITVPFSSSFSQDSITPPHYLPAGQHDLLYYISFGIA